MTDSPPAESARPRWMQSTKLQPVPLIIGPRNAEAVTGFPWRWCRDQATALGIPFVGAGKKRGIRADLFLAALERNGAPPTQAEPTPTIVDPAAHVRALLGKRRKTA